MEENDDPDYTPEEMEAKHLEFFRKAMAHDERMRKMMAADGIPLGDTFMETAIKRSWPIPDEILKEIQ